MKYLVNFKIKAQGWSEIVEVPSNQDSEQDRSDAREKAAELGADDFDTKPVDLNRLIEKMDKYLS